MSFFCNRSSNSSAIRLLRFKFPLALNSPQHVEGAGGRQLPRDEAFGCSTDENSCYSPGKRDLNNKLFVQSGLKDFAGCAHRAASHKRPEQRVRFAPAAPGDKLQSPFWRPQILVREREELEAPVSTGGWIPALQPWAGRPWGDRADTRTGPVSGEHPGSQFHPRRDSPGNKPHEPPWRTDTEHLRTQSGGQSFTPASTTPVSNRAGQEMATFFCKTFNWRCSPV